MPPLLMALASGLAALLAAGLLAAALLHWGDSRADDRAEAALRAGPADDMAFDPAMVAQLPGTARRYFAFSIAPGTPLRRRVELEMGGTFVLGPRQRQQAFAMRARQLLAPPAAFVWRPLLRRGALWISGSDGLGPDGAWTRFWLLSVLPVVRSAGSRDLGRAAMARSLLEAVWAPASLLPRNGARWREIDDTHAEVSFLVDGESYAMELAFAPDGRPLRVLTRRWTDANPQHAFRWQPFGAELRAFGTFAGFTIPIAVEVANQFGTPEAFPFFLGRIERARYF